MYGYTYMYMSIILYSVYIICTCMYDKWVYLHVYNMYIQSFTCISIIVCIVTRVSYPIYIGGSLPHSFSIGNVLLIITLFVTVYT